MKTIYYSISLILSVFLSFVGWGQLLNSTTAGAGTWTATTTECVTIELWGGGGGGGYKLSGTGAGGGGGGGGYVKFSMMVTSGTTYNFSIGAGGTPVASSGAFANPGGDTWFSSSSFALAKGGSGGKNYNGVSNGTGGNGATGNTVPVGGTGANGGNGSAAGSASNPGGGGEAGGANGSGNATNGNNASGTTGGNGATTGGDGRNGGSSSNGNAYGGGAGGSNTTTGYSGGNGGIKITSGGSCTPVGCSHLDGNTATNGSPISINSVNGTSFNMGQYIQVKGMEAGKRYTIHTTCSAYITIGTSGTPKLVAGWSSNNYEFTLPAASGITTSTTVYINLNSDNACGTTGGPCQFYISCMDCDNTGSCINATEIVTYGSYSGTTADNPAPNGTTGGLWPQSSMCGSISIENPEFYTFTANATSINFSLCGGCSGSGVQLAIFEIPSGSSCGSGSVNLIYGIIQVTNGISTSSLCGGGSLSVTNSGSLSCVSTTVSGLVVGKKYYIMIDGYKVSGVGQCPFTLTFSSGISPLSVELLSFTGTPTDLGNELNWVTNTEKNNDYFEVEATLDGVNFETVGRVKGAGNSTKKLTYSLLDRKPLGATTYYRLKQVDFDGTVTHHDLITVTRTMKNQINLFPNPVNDELTVDFNAEMDGTYILSFVGVSGNVVEHPVTLNKGYNRLHLPTSELAKGFYLLKVADENGNTLSTNKVVKE